jgi:hypothetical protein
MHIDGQVFLTTATPVVIKTLTGALELLDFTGGNGAGDP